MAEKQMEDGCGSVAVGDTPTEVSFVTQTTKRCSSTSPSSAPPLKSPRTDALSPSQQTPDAGEEQSEMDKPEMQTKNSDSPAGRKKSWRRATLTRRSLPAHPNPYQDLCRNISTSLSQQERLEKLFESAMKLAIERTQNSIQSVPNISLESFQKQVEHIQTQWGCLTKNMHNEPPQPPSNSVSSSEPVVQKAMGNVQRAINRIQAESESWEELLNKHRSKAEELESKVKKGQQTGISLNSSTMVQSSQYHVIQSKPNYQILLCRQQPMLHAMEIIMDTQHKMIRELISIKEQSQLLVKETSGRLAEEAGFQDLSSDVLRNLMSAPLPTTQASTMDQVSVGLDSEACMSV